MIGKQCVRSLGFDIYASPEADFIADAHDIPLPDDSVDGVWIQAVLEHVIEPDRVVAEIHRVLRPGGIVYAEIPFMQTVHEGAYDFTRLTDTGVRWLFRWFERIDSGTVLGPGSALLWSITAVLTGLLRSPKAGKLLATLLFFWVRFADKLIPRRTRSTPLAGSISSAARQTGRFCRRTLSEHFKAFPLNSSTCRCLTIQGSRQAIAATGGFVR